MIATIRRGSGPLSSGLTLIEVLVVVAILTILILLLVPAVQIARESARRSGCASNLGQLARAAQQYIDSYAVYPQGLYFV